MSTRPRTPAAATPAPGKLPLPELADMKRRGDKIVMITAYDAPAARIADEAGVELILVGDTAAMVMLGHSSTLPVTLDEMIFLTRAVTRAARRPLVVGDLPFGTYEVSDEQAVASAIRMVKEGGADVVKLEGAGRMLGRVRAIADSNIGVMGHVGLTPQSATKLGGFKGRAIGIGPQIGFIIPFSEGYQGYLNLRGYKDLEVENRARTWTAWVTFAVSPAPPEPASAKPTYHK